MALSTSASATQLLPLLFGLLLLLASIPVILIPSVTAIFAAIASIRHRLRSLPPWPTYRTALYSGRVFHTRYRPAVHRFSYPLFFCVLDLDEVDILFGGKDAALWPLSLLMQFRDSDHLKNGEGYLDAPPAVTDEKSRKSAVDNSMRARITRLVAERTEGKCRPTDSQSILLVTHLSYYGYCFNPVSFYYILKEGEVVRPKQDHVGNIEKTAIDAVVAEVSNTPWNEMQCYVLHPESADVEKVKPGRVRPGKDAPVTRFPGDDESDGHNSSDGDESCNDWQSVNYIFQKAFHVSPFMSMDHTYDWTFWMPRSDRISVSTSMIRAGVPYFNAFFDIRRQTFAPLQLFYQLIRLPAYCAIVQVWIHVEAFWLFMKGVEFIPHPEGSETAASRVIASLMAPFFAAKDWLERRRSSNTVGDGHDKEN